MLNTHDLAMPRALRFENSGVRHLGIPVVEVAGEIDAQNSTVIPENATGGVAERG